MAKKYTEDELNTLDQKALIALFMAQQDQIEALNNNLEHLIEQIRVANQQRFGRHTEKQEAVSYEQLSLFNEAEATIDKLYVVEPEIDQVVPVKKTKAKGKREVDISGMEKETPIYHKLSDEQLKQEFGDKWKTLPDEIYYRIKCVPAKYTVEEHHVCVYASTDDRVIRAPRPKSLLRNSLVTPSLAAAIMNGKYVNALPLYRMEQEFKRMGLNISRQVMANWMIQCSDRYLAILYDWLHEKLYDYHVLQADETPVEVNKDGRPAGSKSYMWVYRTGMMYTDKPIILYQYQRTRKQDHPREFLKNFSGVVVTDGYQVYHKLAKERDDLIVAGCWSHARRRFAEAIKAAGKDAPPNSVAAQALAQIGAMFHLDQEYAKLTAEERSQKRNLTIRPLVEAFFAWAKEHVTLVPGKSKTAEGLNYCINQEKYLRYFLEDGEVPMDNNAAERAIRSFCVGKHNWHLIDTINGAKSSAVIYSIAETAKANHLRPLKYFEFLLDEIMKHQDDKDLSFLEDLAPWSETLPDECRQQLN